VRSVDVCNWAFPKEDPGTDTHFSQEELFLVQQAFRAAGMDGMDKCIMSDLRAGDRNPFMALLFTHLPKLSVRAGHLPTYDAFLGGVLNLALMNDHGRPTMQAFQNLKELSVLSEWAKPHGQVPSMPNDLYSFELACWAPLFSLPRLEKLSVFGLDVEDALHHCGPRSRTSSLKYLTLINHEYATATSPEIQAILAMPKALVGLP
jgi:hypothetical protein